MARRRGPHHAPTAEFELSRYIAQTLPWVRYHELPTAGHLFPMAEGMADVIVKSLLLGDD